MIWDMEVNNCIGCNYCDAEVNWKQTSNNLAAFKHCNIRRHENYMKGKSWHLLADDPTCVPDDCRQVLVKYKVTNTKRLSYYSYAVGRLKNGSWIIPHEQSEDLLYKEIVAWRDII